MNIYSIDYKEAMKILDIKSLSDITDRNIKDAWKKRIKKVHPDLAIGDKDKEKELEYQAKRTNEAYEILSKMAESLSISSPTKKEGEGYEICVIDLEGLYKVYSGHSFMSRILINNVEKEVEINKSNIRSKKRVIVQIPYTVVSEGKEWCDIAYCTWNIKDSYSFMIQIPETELSSVRSLSVSIMDKQISFSTNKKTSRLNFRFNYGICISIQVERVNKSD